MRSLVPHSDFAVRSFAKILFVLMLIGHVASELKAQDHSDRGEHKSVLVDAPLLQSPTNGAENISINPTFTWSSARGAQSYTIEIATSNDRARDGSFDKKNLVALASSIEKTKWSVSKLDPDTEYFWHVGADSGSGGRKVTVWSEPFSFKTAPAPSVPVLVSPSDQATGVSTSPTLSWHRSTNADSYLIKYSTGSVILENTVSDTSFTATNLTTGTTYTWQVRAMGPGGASEFSALWTFKTGVGRPAVPVLKSPSNGARDVSTSPTLDWEPVNGGKTYKVEISLNATMSDPFEKAETRASSAYTLSGLKNNTQYYWHVKAVNDDGESDWSAPFSFTTRSGKPNPPQPISPNGAKDVPTSGKLEWSVVSGSSSYDVQVDTDDQFKKLVLSATTASAFYSYSGFLNNQIYFWRVRVTTSGDTSNWSKPASFTTTSGKIAAPKLSKPENNARGVSVSTSLDWEVISGATYDVEVASDNGDIVSSGTGLRTATFAPAGLKYNETYYWHVKATTSRGSSDWSGAWSFTTEASKLSAPNLSSPRDGAKDQPTTITLDWEVVKGALSYGVEIAADGEFKKDKRRSDVAIPSATISGLSPSTKYYWRVQAKDSTTASSWSEVRSFETVSNRLSAPELVEPKDKADVSVSPTLIWKGVNNALAYDVQIATDDKFNPKSVVMKKVGVTGTLLQAGGLSSKTTYYWRVRATNLQSTGEWSNPWEFKTLSSRLAAPQLVSPANGEKTSTSLTLNWTFVRGATSYILQYSTDKDLSGRSVTEISGIDTTSYVLNGLLPKEKYYWRVSAKDTSGESSDWSKVGDFETGESHAPRPELIDPPDKSTGVPINPTLSWALPKNTPSFNGTYTYNLQLSRDREFKDIEVKESNIRTTSFEVKRLKLGGTYYWRVNAADTTGSGDWSDVWRFTVGTDSLSLPVPKLIAPEDGASGVSTRPLLIWDIVKGAKTYTIHLGTDKEFKKDLIIDTSNVKVTALQVRVSLKERETYYWRVSAADSNRTSGWSERRDFETGSGKLSAPALLFPSDAARGVSVNPTLSWKTSVGAISYSVQYSTDKDFSKDINERDSIRVTSLEVKDLALKTEYYWRVNASDSTGPSGWSNTWSFTTGRSRLTAPLLVAPSNDAIGVSISPTFTWTNVKEASQYNLQYSTDKEFKKEVNEVNGLTTTFYRVSPLAIKEKYYWRVQSKDSTAVSDWSEAWSFNTGSSQLLAPSLVSPQDGDEVSTSVLFKWNQVSTGATSYALQVASDEKFSKLVVNEEKLQATSHLVAGLVSKKKFYWRVRAFSDKETGDWSPTWKFKTSLTTAVEQMNSSVPASFRLSQNFPNPFNPSTTIEFSIPKSSDVKLMIYNILGNLVRTLVDQPLSAGAYQAQWNASGLASGVYLYRIQAGAFVETKRLILIK